MRILVEYTREERVKYISHLDLMRCMQRGIRRAGIPIAFSKGFNPHPVMAFASALPVGVTSEGEYMDIELSQPMSLPVFKELLNHALPKGITVREAVVTDEKTPSLMSLIQRADYEVTAEKIDWRKACAAYAYTSEIWVDKKGKKGITTINLKEGVEDIRIDEENPALLHLSMKVGSKGSVKPELVINEILKLSGQTPNPEDLSAFRLSIHRTGLYLFQEGEWITPMALKKD